MEDSAHLHVYPLCPDGDQVIPAPAPLLSFREGILRLVCSLRCPALFPSQAMELFLDVCSSRTRARLCSSRCSGGKLGPTPAPLVHLQVPGSPSVTLVPTAPHLGSCTHGLAVLAVTTSSPDQTHPYRLLHPFQPSCLLASFCTGW